MTAATAGAAGAAAARMQAIKASGTIVQVEPEVFLRLAAREDQPLVVHAPPGGVFNTKHQYLMSHKGLCFATRSQEPLALPRGCDVVEARKVWLP